jgi:hypothetical protein
MKKQVLATVAFVLVAGIAWCVKRDERLSKGLPLVSPGTTQAQLIDNFGRPRHVTECGAFLGTPEHPWPENQDGCIEEYVYASPYAPAIPEYWEVRFDKDRRVLSVEHLVSP